MIESSIGKPKVGRNIFCFEILQLYENLLLSEPSCKQVQNIDHLNPHRTCQGRSLHYAKSAVIRSTTSAMMKQFYE